MTDAEPGPLRAAIIGTGAIAHAHAQALDDLAPRIRLVAVVDVDEQRARDFAERFGAASVYAGLAPMLAAEELDLIQICTPPHAHVPLALQAMGAGIPVLIEKPTALSLAEMDQLVAASHETGVPALTVFQHRYGAAAQRLIRLVANGALGRPLAATCETLWHRTPEYFDLPWRGRWAVEGGGPTMGHGIHQYDLMLAVLGPWRALSAFAARQMLPTDTEDVSTVIVEFDNGALGTVVNSIVSPRETSRLRFDFEFASVEVEHLYGYVDADWTFTPAPGHEDLADHWVTGAGDDISGHRDQIAAIIDALTWSTAPGVDVDDARRTLEFAAATYASAFQGRIVRAGEIVAGDPFHDSMDGGHVPWPAVKGVRA